ncbi:50S ribosomal protein L21, partial [Francisella tularensis]|uniref:50S ribosomal protein L21 n=1 Tax=Francisella tularensis TaxID=263 RepID=UPI002381ABF3
KFDLGIGEKVELYTVLMGQTASGDVNIGAPTVAGAKVVGEVFEQGRHKKVKIIKLRRRKHSKKQQGHPQYFKAVKVSSI